MFTDIGATNGKALTGITDPSTDVSPQTRWSHGIPPGLDLILAFRCPTSDDYPWLALARTVVPVGIWSVAEGLETLALKDIAHRDLGMEMLNLTVIYYY